MGVGNFNLPIQGDYWTPPSDWIDISSVGNNEINMLVADFNAIKFRVTVANSGTYTIDWGDGVVETGRVNNTYYTHTYALGTGTVCSRGYTTFKIRIYNASDTITNMNLDTPTTGDGSLLAKNTYTQPLLWIVYGTNGLTTMNNVYRLAYLLEAVYMAPVISGITTFLNAFAQCGSLQMVRGLNNTWGSVTSTNSMFSLCYSIKNITLPNSWPNTLTDYSGMFSNCTNLRSINLPSTWSTGTTNLSSIFNGCSAIKEIQLPSSWPSGNTTLANSFATCRNLQKITLPSTWNTSLTSTQNMFANCNTLDVITLPSAGFPAALTTTAGMFDQCNGLVKVDLGSSWGGNTSTQQMFRSCFSLQEVVLPSSLGSITQASNMFDGALMLKKVTNFQFCGTSTAGAGCAYSAFFGLSGANFVTGVTLNGYISRVAINGVSGNFNYATAIRLTQGGSTYTGTSPQINVSFCNMGQADLVNLFNDLPTVTSKTINITSNPGAASLTAGERAIATGKGWTIVG